MGYNYLFEKICVYQITAVIGIGIIKAIRFLWKYGAIKQMCLAVNLKELVIRKITV